MAVSCFSAGFPHHSQRLPRGAESTEIGRRNSLVDIRALLVRAGKVDHFLANKTKGSTTQRGNAYLVLSNVRESTAIRNTTYKNTHHRPGASLLWIAAT